MSTGYRRGCSTRVRVSLDGKVSAVRARSGCGWTAWSGELLQGNGRLRRPRNRVGGSRFTRSGGGWPIFDTGWLDWEADIAAGRVRLCFGSKRLWRKQHHLEQNGYASHAEWQQDWRDARSNEFFVLGSRDETSGCQLCVASIADDGSLTLRLRMPDCLAEQHGKYLVIPHVRFAYGHGQVLAALGSNAEYCGLSARAW